MSPSVCWPAAVAEGRRYRRNSRFVLYRRRRCRRYGSRPVFRRWREVLGAHFRLAIGRLEVAAVADRPRRRPRNWWRRRILSSWACAAIQAAVRWRTGPERGRLRGATTAEWRTPTTAIVGVLVTRRRRPAADRRLAGVTTAARGRTSPRRAARARPTCVADAASSKRRRTLLPVWRRPVGHQHRPPVTSSATPARQTVARRSRPHCPSS